MTVPCRPPARLWAVRHPDGYLIPSSVTASQANAVARMAALKRSRAVRPPPRTTDENYALALAAGYRVTRVRLVQVIGPDPGREPTQSLSPADIS